MITNNSKNEHQPFDNYNEELEIKEKMTYHQYGFQSAATCNSKSEAITGFLANVYERFLNEQKLDEEGLRQRISKLKSEVQQKKTKRSDTNAEIASNKQYKEDKEKQIEELELEKIDIKNNGEVETSDTIPFVIGAFITILLTFYLFVFYSSSGYSAFYGVKQGSLGFINANVFADATIKGGGVIALIILFPVIFLGLGFLIHDALEKIKRSKTGSQKTAPILTILILLTITLIADAFIGYKIAQGVHNNDYNAGTTEKLWEFSMVYSDINFYLVLILGFVVYVIWGFLLNFVLSHPYLKSESEKVKIQIQYIDNRISEKRTELSQIVTKITSLISIISNLENEITEKEKDIIGYENGVIPVNVPLLSASVGEFMGGWLAYTKGYFNEKEIVKLNNEAIFIQENWLNTKIQNLNSDN